MGHVFSVGYRELRPGELVELATTLDATVVDVRSRPSGRVKRGFSRAQLTELLGDHYDWRGDVLGGMGVGPTDDAIEALARQVGDGLRALLMCAEVAPGDCHRYHWISIPLWESYQIDAWHIVGSDCVQTSEMLRARAEHDDELDGLTLDELVAELAEG